MSKKSIVFKMPNVDGHTDIEVAVSGQIEANDLAPASISADPLSGRFPIDIGRERELGEVVTLAFALPAMLVWFWWANAVERYSRTLAV